MFQFRVAITPLSNFLSIRSARESVRKHLLGGTCASEVESCAVTSSRDGRVLTPLRAVGVFGDGLHRSRRHAYVSGYGFELF